MSADASPWRRRRGSIRPSRPNSPRVASDTAENRQESRESATAPPVSEPLELPKLKTYGTAMPRGLSGLWAANHRSSRPRRFIHGDGRANGRVTLGKGRSSVLQEQAGIGSLLPGQGRTNVHGGREEAKHNLRLARRWRMYCHAKRLGTAPGAPVHAVMEAEGPASGHGT